MRFSIKNPVAKVKEYTSILRKYFGPNTSRDIPFFYAKHIYRPILCREPFSELLFDDYQKIDPNFQRGPNFRDDFNKMHLLKPFIYCQLINPKQLLWTTTDYPNFFRPLTDYYDKNERITTSFINNLDFVKTIKYNFRSSDYYDRTRVYNFFSCLENYKQNVLAQTAFVKKLDLINYDKINPENYIRFLKLIAGSIETVKNKRGREYKKIKHLIVPTLEIDLFWHLHMLYPDIYRSDCYANFGFLLDHNDKLSETELSKGRILTEDLWKKSFGEFRKNSEYMKINPTIAIAAGAVGFSSSVDKTKCSSGGCGICAGSTCGSCGGSCGGGCGGCGGCG